MDPKLIRAGRSILMVMNMGFGFVAGAQAQAPQILRHPASTSVIAGNPVSLDVLTSGNFTLSYQWRKDGSIIPVATGSNLSIQAATEADAGSYTVTVQSSAGSVTSNTAVVTVNLPPKISAHPLSQTTTLGGSVTLSVVATGTGELEYQWYRNGASIPEATKTAYAIAMVARSDAGEYSVQVGSSFGQAVSSPAQVAFSGMLWTKGVNTNGQLGDGTTTNRTAPAQVATGVKALAGGNSHNFFIKADGTLWAMGRNDRGQLGDGTTTNRPAPVLLGGGVIRVATANLHSLFLRSDGTLLAVGNNQFGQLGDGTTTSRLSPVPVATGVIAIAAGDAHSLFVKADGTLWAVGNNQLGQLGDGTQTHRSVPVKVATGVRALAAGAFHSLFVKWDGTLWAMGDNQYGQLGDGTTTNHPSPVQVATEVSVVAVRSSHSLFTRTDGTLWAMGNNVVGQLGDLTTINRGLPVRVATDVTSIAAGVGHNLFVRTDGSLWGMGSNQFGQLVDGAPTNRTSPVQIATGVAEVVAGDGQSAFTQISGFGSAPRIISSSAGGLLAVGASVSLSVSATGSEPIDYQWTKNGVAILSARSATLSFSSLAPTDEGSYAVVVANSAGSVTSSPAAITINTPPVITIQPATSIVNAGSEASFSVTAVGGSPLSYQWYKDGLGLTGATNSAFSLRAATRADAGGYSVTVSNRFGVVTSSAAALVVNSVSAPAISAQPVAVSTTSGNTARFAIVVTGTGPFSFQWRKDGVPIAGAVNDTLILNNVLKRDAGSYSVSVSNSAGVITSAAAILTVNAFDPGRIVNLSILTQLAAGETMTLGTVLGGEGTGGDKPLLVRAAGPALTQFGVAAVLADPTLTLRSEQTTAGVNDNWDASLRGTFSQTGAFSFVPGSKDAAIFSPALSPGAYTMQISGVGGAAGSVIAELYDATVASDLSVATPRLVNISALKQISAGEVLAAGFVIAGSTPKTVLIRAVGATLGAAPFYVAGAMEDPILYLFRGQTLISSNDNWGAGALASALASAFTRLGAFSLRGDSTDAALIVTLQPGNYTAQIAGVDGSGGVALVEVYEVP